MRRLNAANARFRSRARAYKRYVRARSDARSLTAEARARFPLWGHVAHMVGARVVSAVAVKLLVKKFTTQVLFSRLVLTRVAGASAVAGVPQLVADAVEHGLIASMIAGATFYAGKRFARMLRLRRARRAYVVEKVLLLGEEPPAEVVALFRHELESNPEFSSGFADRLAHQPGGEAREKLRSIVEHSAVPVIGPTPPGAGEQAAAVQAHPD